MSRGRPPRESPLTTSAPQFAWNAKLGKWEQVGSVRFRLGVRLGAAGEDITDETLKAEHFEFCVRLNRHLRPLLALPLGEEEEEKAYCEAESKALAEMRDLQQNGGAWLTQSTAPIAPRAGGRPAKSPDVLQRWLKLKQQKPTLSRRSGAAIIAKAINERPAVIEGRLRRAINNSAPKPARK